MIRDNNASKVVKHQLKKMKIEKTFAGAITKDYVFPRTNNSNLKK